MKKISIPKGKLVAIQKHNRFMPSAQDRKRGSKHSDNDRGQVEVTSALLNVGTGNDSTLDTPALEAEQNKIPNTNLEGLIENSLRGDDTNLMIAFSGSDLIKIDDVGIDPN